MATHYVNLSEEGHLRKPQRWIARVRRWVGQAIFNLIPFAIVGVFFWIQMEIDAQGDGWLIKFELGLTVVFELALVFIWSLFIKGR